MSSQKNRDAARANMLKGAGASVSGVTEDRFAKAMGLTPDAAANGALPPVKFIDVSDVKPRLNGDLRPVNERHALALARSFVVVGLLHFPVVDQDNVLIAGEHRRIAVLRLKEAREKSIEEIRTIFEASGDPVSDEEAELLRTEYDETFGEGMLVHVVDTTGLGDTDVRKLIEFIENDHRRDFTRDEIGAWVDQLKKAGARHSPGPPMKGQKVLSKEVGLLLGKSRATVFRILKELETPAPPRIPISPSSEKFSRIASAKLETVVKVKDHPRKPEHGVIAIEYTSFKQRAELLRAMGVLDK